MDPWQPILLWNFCVSGEVALRCQFKAQLVQCVVDLGCNRWLLPLFNELLLILQCLVFIDLLLVLLPVFCCIINIVYIWFSSHFTGFYKPQWWSHMWVERIKSHWWIKKIKIPKDNVCSSPGLFKHALNLSLFQKHKQVMKQNFRAKHLDILKNLFKTSVPSLGQCCSYRTNFQST